MAEIAKQITELIGRTPMLQLCNFQEDNNVSANIIAKLEYFNPLSSVKDRVAYAMIEDGIKQGKINKDTVIIEPTSGNTGIGLAGVCAAKKLKLILTMPDTMSVERRKIVTALGAEVVLTQGRLGMKGAIAKAEQLKEEYGNAFIPQQFDNPSNPEIHRVTTAKEIAEATDGKVDIFILLPLATYLPFSSFKMTSPSFSIFSVTRLSPSDIVRSKSSLTIPSASFFA